MAEIEIERKGGMAWLWWLLGLALVLLLGWFVFAGSDDEEVAIDPVVTEQPVAVVPIGPADTGMAAGAGAAAAPAIQEYVTTCGQAAPAEMGLDHAYTSNCLTRLVGAVEAVLRDPSMAGANADAELATARESAERLAQSPTAAEHSRMTREAFTAMASLFDRVQDDRQPALDAPVDELEATAEGLSVTAPLLEQRAAVQGFFQQAGEILSGMTPSV